jgi:hypothetical protein
MWRWAERRLCFNWKVLPNCYSITNSITITNSDTNSICNRITITCSFTDDH